MSHGNKNAGKKFKVFIVPMAAPACDAGTGTLAVFAGGDNPTPGLLNATEEWTVGQNVKVITD